MKKYSFLDHLGELWRWTVFLTFTGGWFILGILYLILPDMPDIEKSKCICMIYLILCLSISCYLIVESKIAEFHERKKIERIMNGEEIAKIEKNNCSFLEILGELLLWTLILSTFGGEFILGIFALIFQNNIESFKLICMIYLILCLVIGSYWIVDNKMEELQKKRNR